jgi:hypothetical protein
VHPLRTTVPESKREIDELTKLIVLRRVDSESSGMSDAECEEMAEARADWHFIKSLLGLEGITLNSDDYKKYMLVSAAIMYGNHRLIEKLGKEIGSADLPPVGDQKSK